jgi:hypothetical protein
MIQAIYLILCILGTVLPFGFASRLRRVSRRKRWTHRTRSLFRFY